MKISIITVCFNSAETIADTLRSVSDQTYPDIEHIVVDGASSDNTRALIEVHRKRVAKLISEPDDGIYDAMNKGIALATGDVIGCINSDDFYASTEAIAKVAAAFAHPAVDAVYGDLCYVRQEDTSRVVRYWRSSVFLPGLFNRGWCPPHPTLFLRRGVYERCGVFDLQYRIAADVELMARLFEVQRINAVYLNEILVTMRMGGTTNSSLRNIFRQNREIWHALKAHRLDPSLLAFIVGKLGSRGRQYLSRPARR